MTLPLAGVGCRNSGLTVLPEPLAIPPLSSNTVFRVYWRGKDRLGTEASAFYLMRLWKLPQSWRLESQTLVKLSTAPWRLKFGEAAAARAPAQFFGPLLQDAVQHECYLEIRRPPRQRAEAVFAIRVDERRAGLWRTNLVAVIASLTGIQKMDLLDHGQGWALRQLSPPERFELRRVAGWTVVGMAPDTNTLMAEFVGRLLHPAEGGTNATNWLQAYADLARLPEAAAGLPGFPEGLPRAWLTVTGDGGDVLSQVRLKFPRSFPSEPAVWSIPTNLIHAPLDSFTAIRGVQSWLAENRPLGETRMGTPPDQVFCWSLPGGAPETYLAAPLPHASNEVNRLVQYLMNTGNPWLTAHGYVPIKRLPDADGVTWGRMQAIEPFLKWTNSGSGGSLFTGLRPLPSVRTNSAAEQLYYRPPIDTLLTDVTAQTNLIYYDWEISASRVQADMYLGQLLRAITRRTELPMNCVGAAWLAALTPRLGNSTTTITRTAPDELTFDRRSTIGFTGAELQLLVDWLESPRFPLGLYSLSTPH